MIIKTLKPYQTRIYELIDSYLTYGQGIYLRSCIKLNTNIALQLDEEWSHTIHLYLQNLVEKDCWPSDFMSGEILGSVKHMLLYYRMSLLRKDIKFIF